MTSSTERRGPGRPRNVVAKSQRTIAVDSDVADMVDILLMDPLTRKPEHGRWGSLITQLLREWVRNQSKQGDR